jgi:hypothetical protein
VKLAARLFAMFDKDADVRALIGKNAHPLQFFLKHLGNQCFWRPFARGKELKMHKDEYDEWEENGFESVTGQTLPSNARQIYPIKSCLMKIAPKQDKFVETTLFFSCELLLMGFELLAKKAFDGFARAADILKSLQALPGSLLFAHELLLQLFFLQQERGPAIGKELHFSSGNTGLQLPELCVVHLRKRPFDLCDALLRGYHFLIGLL